MYSTGFCKRGICRTPEGMLSGYSLMIQEVEKHTGRFLPMPGQLAIITEKHQRYNTDQ